MYTLQERLGRFGARWACYATCLINICENERGCQASDKELQRILGIWLLEECVLLSNYKNHKAIMAEMPGWSGTADPEWHFYVKNQNKALAAVMGVMGITQLKKHYEIQELRTVHGAHFVLKVGSSGMVINPDPNLSGEVVGTRSVPV